LGIHPLLGGAENNRYKEICNEVGYEYSYKLSRITEFPINIGMLQNAE